MQQVAFEQSAQTGEMAAIPDNRPPLSGGHPVPVGGQRRRELEPLSVDRFGVHFTADAELRDLIERARALASHRLPKGDLAALVKLMAASFVRQEEKRRFGIGARQRRVNRRTNSVSATDEPTPPGGVPAPPKPTEPKQSEGRVVDSDKRSRYLSVAVRREAHERDRGQCSFVSADGRRCDAGAFLEFDHVKPFARRGGCDAQNIRLLCKAHNLLHARNCFGSVHVETKIAARERSRPMTLGRPK